MSTVLVTGASTGFGVEIALAFAARGDTVYGASRRGTAAEGVIPLQLDVSDPESRARALERVGDLDVLVNNAGTTWVAAWEDTPDEELRHVFETNFFGPLALIRAVVPAMRERGSGRIVNVSSLGGMFSLPFNGPYSTTKHALNALTGSLRGELAPFGIHVSTVLPGSYKTALYENSPIPPDSEPYAAPAGHYRRRLMTRHKGVTPDYTDVVEAVLHAATAAEPKARYLAAPPEQAEAFASLVALLDEIDERYVANRLPTGPRAASERG
jgi:NAD(P)-dependent dehydrogenase (short-subunit alcohol dehydrogenase family)